MSYAQTTKQAAVESILNLGIYDLIVLKENNTTIYYKSGLILSGNNFQQNQQITITYLNNSNELVSFIDVNSNQIFCTKIVQQNQNNTIESLNLSSISLENGVLFFDDKQHFDETYEAIVDIIDNSDTSIVEIEVLEEIEDEFTGYNSFRGKFNEIHVNEDGLFSNEELEYMFKRDFILDEIEKTLLNEDRFVGIGDEIYYYHSLNNYVVFDKTKDDVKDLFKQIDQNFNLYSLQYEYEKYDSIYDDDSPLDSIVKDEFITLYSDKQFYIYNPNVVTSSTVETRAVSYDEDSIYKYETVISVVTPDCGNLTRGLHIELWQSKENDTVPNQFDNIYTTKLGTLTIEWGDGTSETINNFNGIATTTFWHTYPSQTTYYPETEVEIEDEGDSLHTLIDGNNTTGVDIKVQTEIGCTKKEVIQDAFTISGDWRMYSALIIKGFLGNKIKGVTKSYKKAGNSWEEKKSELYVEVHGWFRKSNCLDATWRYGNKSRKKRKSISKTKPKVRKHWAYANGQIWSIHTLKKGNVTLYKEHVLIPCP
jgi:hypothetical protein